MGVFRKNEPKPKMFHPSDDIRIVERQTSADVGKIRVAFPLVYVEEINKQVLDPALWNITSVIESGQIIEPKQVFNLLNISDPADIESYNDIQNQTVYKFLKENEDILPQLLKTEDYESCNT